MMSHDEQLDELRFQCTHLMELATKASALHLATAGLLTEHKVRILSLERVVEELRGEPHTRTRIIRDNGRG